MPITSSTDVHSLSRQLSEAYVALSKSDAVWHSSLVQALRYITQTCANVLGVERASIWQTSPDLVAMECLCLYREDSNSFEQGAVLEARSFPRYFSALALERVINASDALNPAGNDACARDHPTVRANGNAPTSPKHCHREQNKHGYGDFHHLWRNTDQHPGAERRADERGEAEWYGKAPLSAAEGCWQQLQHWRQAG